MGKNIKILNYEPYRYLLKQLKARVGSGFGKNVSDPTGSGSATLNFISGTTVPVYLTVAVGALHRTSVLGHLVHAENVRAQVAALAKFDGAEGAGVRTLSGVLQTVRF